MTETLTLGRYADWQGGIREVVTRRGLAGSVLVVDRDATTHGDRRLVAHIAPDEPPGNAALVGIRYLEEAPDARCRCRRVTAEDTYTVPFADQEQEATEPHMDLSKAAQQPADRLGCVYALSLVQSGMSIPELRWCRARPGGGDHEPVSLRKVVAQLQSYEPARTLTLRALASHRDDSTVSIAMLRSELRRVQESPIVLNRGLREQVLRAVEQQGLSLSEIATRCGRIKRDGKGNQSGETSWLARRLGILPEAGRRGPTPWVHSDVLALITRWGLGISPREAEL